MSWKCPHCHGTCTAQPPADLLTSRSPERIHSLKEVVAITGLSPSTISRRIKEGTFPPGILISRRRRGWPQSSIDAWVRRLAADRFIEVPPD